MRRNVLALDGGGVRGLSSLLILQALMLHINATVQKEGDAGETYDELKPQDVFDLVAGTSTGGLIAIMLGKLGMNLEECIHSYQNLSETIFGKKHFRGRVTHGLAPTKYSGKCLEKAIQGVMEGKGLGVTATMFPRTSSNETACVVLCREHGGQSQYSDFRQKAVPICSLPCYTPVPCLVSEAARATSAAPTFFPVQRIDHRYFVDGGMEYNNPSEAIFDHYIRCDFVAATGIHSTAPEAGSSDLRHGELDLSLVRFVNLGTGTKPENLPPRQRDRLATLVPNFIRMGFFLKRTLTEFAVNAQKTAQHMQSIAWVSKDSTSVDLKYERFSADTGVCYVKMDKYKALDRIESMAQEYLNKDSTKKELKRVGEEIAREFLQRNRPGFTFHAISPSLAVPHSAPPSSHAPPSGTSDEPEPSTKTSVNTSSAFEGAEGSLLKAHDEQIQIVRSHQVNSDQQASALRPN